VGSSVGIRLIRDHGIAGSSEGIRLIRDHRIRVMSPEIGERVTPEYNLNSQGACPPNGGWQPPEK